MLRRTAAAYIAGYFDADGCVSVSLNKSTLSVKVSISGRNKPLCARMEIVFGGSTEVSPVGNMTWYGYSATAFAFMQDIRSYVSYKKDQVELAIAVLDTDLSALSRLRAAFGICKLNQQNMSEPQITKTMRRLAAAIEQLGGHVDLDG